jgi:uncharacterized protein (TIRG00374 family)
MSLAHVRKAISVVIAVAVVAAVFGFALPKFASYDQAWNAILAMTPTQISVLAALAAGRLLLPAWQMQAALAGVQFWPCFAAVNWGAAMANTVPAGGALGVGVMYEMLLSWGSSVAAVTRMLLVTGIWNDFVRLALPVAAVALLAVAGDNTDGHLGIALVGFVVLVAACALLVVVLRSEKAAAAVGNFAARVATAALRFLKRPPVTGWGDKLVAFDRDTSQILRARWMWLTASTVSIEMSYFTLVLLSARFVGITHAQVDAVEVFAAYVFMRLLQIVPITPGGLGVVQLGLAGALGSFGAPNSAAAAAALVYTALTWLPPIPVGVGAFFVWRRLHPHREPVQAQPALR